MSQANVEMRMLGTVALLWLAGAQVSALSAQQSGGLPCEHWNTSSLPSGFAARCLAAGADPNARWGATAATPLDVLRNSFERLGAGPRRPPLYWLLNDVTAR